MKKRGHGRPAMQQDKHPNHDMPVPEHDGMPLGMNPAIGPQTGMPTPPPGYDPEAQPAY